MDKWKRENSMWNDILQKCIKTNRILQTVWIKLVTFSKENNPTIPPPTPGLSVRMASMCVEAEECVCSARCDGDEAYCARGEDGGDECVCTASCEGRGSHAHVQERSEEIKLGIKYCPGTEPVLPEYEYVEYKAKPSTREFTIYRYSTTITQPGPIG